MKQMTLDEAASVALGLWGQTREQPGRQLLLPDQLIEIATSAGATVLSKPFVDMEERSDESMYEEALSPARPIAGDIIMITERSFEPSAGAMVFDDRSHAAALAQHKRLLGRVFDGDTIFVIPQQRKVVLVHHSGFLMTILAEARA